jgi:hypothetical protein
LKNKITSENKKYPEKVELINKEVLIKNRLDNFFKFFMNQNLSLFCAGINFLTSYFVFIFDHFSVDAEAKLTNYF